MGLLRWFTRNWANTVEPTHADLVPLRVPLPEREVRSRIVAKIAAGVPGWRVEDAKDSAGRIHLTRRTRICRFVDDVWLTLTPEEEGQVTRIDAESRSRVGVGDLGQNRRNIMELWSLLRQEFAVSGETCR